MAVLQKARGRKAVVVSAVGVSYGNYAVPGLHQNKHVCLMMNGNPDAGTKSHYLKMNFTEAERVANDILMYIREYRDER